MSKLEDIADRVERVLQVNGINAVWTNLDMKRGETKITLVVKEAEQLESNRNA